MSADLVTWFRACLDEDAELAQQIVDRDAWHGIHVDSATVVATHINRWDPARVLAEVAAKRELLALHDDGGRDCVTCGDAGVVGYPCPTARALVAPFASRAGFDPSWLD